MRSSAAVLRVRAEARPRFFFEIAAAGFLTLCAVLLAAKSTRPAAPAAKVSLQAAPLAPQAVARDDQSVAEFMERFALSRLAPPLPEKFVVADGGSGVGNGRPAAGRAEESGAGAASAQARSAPAKEKVRSVAFKPQAAPQPPRREIERPSEPVFVAQRLDPAPARKIPVISFIAEKIPNGRDIGDAMASVGKRVGSLFTRG